MFEGMLSAWLSRTTNEVEREIEATAHSIGLWILAGLLMAMALGFTTWLVYDALAPIFGPKPTLAAFAACSGLGSAYFALRARGKVSFADPPAEPKANGEKLRDAPPTEPLGDMQASMDQLVELLGNAGMRKEALGLMAAKGALGDVKPLQLVGLALMAGFIVGRGR